MNERATTFSELLVGDWFLFNDNLYIKESYRFAIDLISTTTLVGDEKCLNDTVAFQDGEVVIPVSKADILNEIRLY